MQIDLHRSKYSEYKIQTVVIIYYNIAAVANPIQKWSNQSSPSEVIKNTSNDFNYEFCCCHYFFLKLSSWVVLCVHLL